MNIGGSYIIGTPTMQELETAHNRYYNEVSTGDLFYRVATELVDLAIHKKNRKREFIRRHNSPFGNMEWIVF
jgi:hypothetical protein